MVMSRVNSGEGDVKMRLVPFSRDTVIELVVFALLPVLPLTLTLISFEELLTRALNVVF